jgi:hypothetical protein
MNLQITLPPGCNYAAQFGYKSSFMIRLLLVLKQSSTANTSTHAHPTKKVLALDATSMSFLRDAPRKSLANRKRRMRNALSPFFQTYNEVSCSHSTDSRRSPTLSVNLSNNHDIRDSESHFRTRKDVSYQSPGSSRQVAGESDTHSHFSNMGENPTYKRVWPHRKTTQRNGLIVYPR